MMLRTVQHNLLSSEAAPKIQIRVDPSFTYVGGLTCLLGTTTAAEQHHFIQAAKQKVIRHLWFQFEGFLDTNQHQYQDDPYAERLKINDFIFAHDADFFNWDSAILKRPNSDSAQAVNFLGSQGFRLEGNSIFKRLVWLDQEKRNELMIIFSEDLGLAPYRELGPVPNDQSTAPGADLTGQLHDRALASFTIN